MEIKNVTGVRNLISAAEYEIKRQSALIKEGKGIKAETRSYKEDTDETVSSREKETEEEYGFTFEPDLTFYSTKEIQPQKPVIASKVAKDLADKNQYSEKTIKELILFNKRNMSLLLDVNKEDFRKAISLIEKFASFGIEDYSREEFNSMLKTDITSVERPEFMSLLGREKAAEANVDKEEIKKYIRDTLSSDKNLLDRGLTDPKVIGFMIGQVKEKYPINGKDAADLIKKEIKDLQNK